MGSSKSKEEIVREVYVESDEALALAKLDMQLDSLKEEVESFKQHYSSEEVQQTVLSTDDVIVLHYKELEDMDKISSNIDGTYYSTERNGTERLFRKIPILRNGSIFHSLQPVSRSAFYRQSQGVATS